MKKINLSFLSFFLIVSVFAQSPLSDEFYAALPFKMNPIKAIDFPANEESITDFGAKGDGLFDNTEAFAKAINTVAAKGGGTVNVPMGHWATGPIVFQNNINLHLDKGALITFSRDKTKYPIIKTSFEGYDTRRCQSPISGKNLKNIAITGQGVIDGSGHVWRAQKKNKLTPNQWKELVNSGGVVSDDGKNWYPSKAYEYGNFLKKDQNVPNVKDEATWEEIRDFLRPVMISFISCENVLFDGVTFQNSPAWCIHPLMCTNVQVLNVFVKNEWNAQNSDALDLESCKNALVYNSTFDVGDDGICIKSGKDEDGRKRGIPSENIIVEKCMVYHGHGGFVVGSEMSGGVKNIYVNNCLFMGTDIGLRFKSTRGRGGVVENIHISNIHMVNILNDPLSFNLYYGHKNIPEEVPSVPVSEETPSIKDIYIKNISCNGADRAMLFRGLPEMNVQNINLEDVTIMNVKHGAELFYSDGINMKNVHIDAAKSPMMRISNVKNVSLDNISSSKPEEDLITVSGKETKNISMKNMKLKKEQVETTVRIKGL